MAVVPQQPLTFHDVFEGDDGAAEPKAAPTVHHIRANSSIMQLKKILGESCLHFASAEVLVRNATARKKLTCNVPNKQSPTVAKSVSHPDHSPALN